MKPIFHRKVPIAHRVDLGDTNFGKPPRIQTVVYLYVFIFLIASCFFFIAVRLFQLTVVKGEYYKRLSEENRIREIVIEPKRGSILDRKGFVLVESRRGNIEEQGDRIVAPRTYLVKEEAAHVVGYRQVADANDIKNDNCVNKLKLGDKVGKKGVEQLYDCQLRGVPGKKLIEVDAHGKYLRTISVIPPIDGDTIRLSIDLDLQKKAYEAVKNKRAAVIGLNPSGQVLVFVSTPSFDPQKFEDGDAGVNTYFTDTEKPLFDRVVEGTYPPGSLFKLFIAAGGLEEKKITPETIVEDNGFIKAGAASFGNWYYLQYGKTEGSVNLLKAIQRSNDIYFYKAGEALEPEGIKKWASMFGLNEETHIGFHEAEATLPSPFWKQETMNEQWYLGDTYNTSIGQGYTLITPLQMARAVLPFSNGGSLCSLDLLKNDQPSCSQMKISGDTFSLIRQGMMEACSTGGTGWPLFDFKVKNQELIMKKLEETSDDKKASVEAAVNRDPAYFKGIQTACKTGTAESHAKSGTPHAWFTVFAPYDKPEISLTVLVEEGGQGSDVAAPIARDILKTYFERKE